MDSTVTDTAKTIAIISLPNNAPSNPNIIGPSIGKKTEKYNFSFISSDVDNDTIKYFIDWGDGTRNISQLMPQNNSYSLTHSWTQPDIYQTNPEYAVVDTP